MIVLLDVGNSRFKWGIMGELTQVGVRYGNHTGPNRAQGVFQSLQELRPERIVVSSVLDTTFQDALSRLTHDAFSVKPEFVQTDYEAHGIRVAYADPANLGVDRFVAMIAAHGLFNTACIIVDAGTAVTIDALSAQGRHRGGLILPGLSLMRRCLTKQTANIRMHERADEATLFATNTADGVNSGTLRTIAAAIENISTDMAAELDGPVTYILCGGDAEIVRPWLRREYLLYPDLVLKGLAFVASS